MALNWQDVAQVRFQDTTQAAKNISDSLGSLGDPLQAVIDSQTEDRQNALDSAIAQQQMKATGMSAMASGMNAQASMLDIQRKTSPEYIEMENQKIQAQLALYKAQMLEATTNSNNSQIENEMTQNAFPELFNNKKGSTNISVPIDNNSAFTGAGSTDVSTNVPTNASAVQPQVTTNTGTNYTKYDAISMLNPKLQSRLTKKYDTRNVQSITNKYPALSAGASNAEWANWEKVVTQDLKSQGLDKSSSRLVERALGTYNRSPLSLSDAKTLDARAAVITAVDSNALSSLTIGDSALVDAYGSAKAAEIKEGAIDTVYAGINKQMIIENPQFNPADPSNIFAPSNLQNRNAHAKYNAFQDATSDFTKSTRERLEAQYIADNRLDKNIVNSLANSRNADQKIAIQTATSQLQKKDFKTDDIDSVMQTLQGVPVENLAGIHDLALGHIVKDLDNQFIIIEGEKYSIKKAGKFLHDAELKHMTPEKIAKRERLISNFGGHLNALIDNAIPGPSSPTKIRLKEELSIRLQIPQIERKIEIAKDTLKYKSKFFDEPKFRGNSLYGPADIMTNESYGGDEHLEMKNQAEAFVKQSLAKMKKEGHNPSKILPFAKVKELAYKTFSDIFNPEDEFGETDDWVFSKGILGDDEISISGSRDNYIVDYADAANFDAYKIFKKELERQVVSMQSARDSFVEGKLNQK